MMHLCEWFERTVSPVQFFAGVFAFMVCVCLPHALRTLSVKLHALDGLDDPRRLDDLRERVDARRASGATR